jgi:hypothetical protein
MSQGVLAKRIGEHTIKNVNQKLTNDNAGFTLGV